MTLLMKSVAQSILEPYIEMLDIIIQTAFDRYHKQPDKHEHTPRSRASLIHDFMIINAESEFINYPGVSIHDSRGLVLFNFGDEIMLRFKKMDRRLRPANIPTQQALAFEEQGQLPLFQNYPPATHVTAGYVPNDAWTQIDQKIITCYKGNELEWVLPIEPSAVLTSVVTFPQSARKITHQNRRVWPKRNRTEKRKSEAEEKSE